MPTNLNYQKICSNLLGGLPERTKEILVRRFGLKNGGERETLENIGKDYKLTRERVRQIEEDGMNRLKRPEALKAALPVFNYFQDYFKNQGGLKREDILLSDLGQDKKSCVFFLLTLGEPFLRYAETDNYYPFWTINQDLIQLSQGVINRLVADLQKIAQPLPKDNFFEMKIKELRNQFGRQVKLELVISSYEIAKKIEENAFGEVGLINWSEIKPRGIKDRAYLILKKEGKPLHFIEITDRINKFSLYPDQALSQTVHNELIKDPRFILVGRGIYGLADWGYKPGWVRDVILDVLKAAKKPLTKEEILEKVLNQRLVKANTILLNLTNKDYFKKTKDGKYTIK